jgi:hypothetical protein
MATAQEQLDACEATILIVLRGGVAEYSEAGKDYTNLSLTELYKIRDRLKDEVAAEAGNYTVLRPVVRGD